jgi:multiple sugar transport system ATP-binding protein
MNVYDNIAFPLKIAKSDKAEIEKKVTEVADTLELSELLDAKPGELSGGQRQRVALGRAIVRTPAVLLLDEPLSNLDALLRVSMRSELKRIQRSLKLTTVYVTHDQTEAMSLADRMAILKGGEVQQIDNPDQIYDNPASLFVAGFVGTPPINQFRDKTARQICEKIEKPEGMSADKLVLGVRPENLRFTDPEDAILVGEVNMIASTGSEQIVYIGVNDQEVLVKVAGKVSIGETERVGLTFNSKDVYFFDKKFGVRIDRQ